MIPFFGHFKLHQARSLTNNHLNYYYGTKIWMTTKNLWMCNVDKTLNIITNEARIYSLTVGALIKMKEKLKVYG